MFLWLRAVHRRWTVALQVSEWIQVCILSYRFYMNASDKHNLRLASLLSFQAYAGGCSVLYVSTNNNITSHSLTYLWRVRPKIQAQLHHLVLALPGAQSSPICLLWHPLNQICLHKAILHMLLMLARMDWCNASEYWIPRSVLNACLCSPHRVCIMSVQHGNLIRLHGENSGVWFFTKSNLGQAYVQ